MIITPQAARALEQQARNELRLMSEQEALEATDRLLSMAAEADYPEEREQSSGLIERQKILFRLH